MQSQQKKVKWSRGETADALEERTDTGITQVSVAKMENIIADIYGNISRRPALKIVSQPTYRKTNPVMSEESGVEEWATRLSPSSFVFTINSNTYVIFVIGESEIQGFKIIDNQFANIVTITNAPTTIKSFGNFGQFSFAQSNNWGILSNVWNSPMVLKYNPTTDTFYVEPFQFSAPWYAPNGTQTKTVNDSTLPGIEFNKDGHGFMAFSWVDQSGNSTPCHYIDTGLTGDTTNIEEAIPLGSIVKFPNLGAYMRVEGYDLGGHTVYFADYDFDDVILTRNPPASGLVVGATNTPEGVVTSSNFRLIMYRNGVQFGETIRVAYGSTVWVRCSTSLSGFKQLTITKTTVGQNKVYTASWSDVPSAALDVHMFGPLLTPVAKGDAKDTSVTVEYGFVSLNSYYPTEFTFSEQRLFATKWKTNELSLGQKEIPGYIVGSQIGRFTDFKNDYNTQSEAIVIDINTQYQEMVTFVSDYNGLKIFCQDTEYAYSQQNGVIKQSTNGSSELVRPIVFGSNLLYVDKTNQQIRALQYEFQTDVFQSNVINQMCQTDLITNPISLSSTYDKENHTGSFIYTIQSPIELNDFYMHYGQPVPIAVCNFVPGNQAEIWSRWTVPTIPFSYLTPEGQLDKPTVVNSITVNNKTWFIIYGKATIQDGSTRMYQGYSLAELDFNKQMDFEINAQPTDTKFILNRNTGVPPISLLGWNISTTYVYTEYNIYHMIAVGDKVYNRNGVEIGSVTAVDTVSDPNTITISSTDPMLDGRTYSRLEKEDIIIKNITFPGATVSVFDGDQYMWDDTLDANGNYTKSLSTLQNARVGFMVNATLESHPLDIQGKTYTEKKRIGKCVAVIRNTDDKAFTVCDKTGYTSTDKKTVNFYGCTGMKDKVQYTIKNIKGAKFTIESLTMIIEYGTLDS